MAFGFSDKIQLKTLLIRLWRLSFFIHFSATLILFYPLFVFLFTHPKFYRAALKAQRGWASWLLFWAGIRTCAIFEEDIRNKGPFIWCPNHTSALDILEMYAIVPTYFHFVAKKEHAQTPFFGIMFSKTHIPINRNSITDAFKGMQRAMQDLKKGTDIVLFPEGTMNFKRNTFLSFKSGAFKLACDADCPVLPVYMPDNLVRLPYTYRILYPGGGPGRARVMVGKPLYPKDFGYDPESLKAAVTEFMEQQALKFGEGV
jgi:1-acyl-sn-glycerol-3-phosphate acyltransferase